jgi:hypothetical protein
MSIRVLLLTAALVVAIFMSGIVLFGSTSAQAADDEVEIAAVGVSPQIDGVADDSRVEVQTWTLVGVAGAAAVGLLALMVRVIMGWVKPPPAPDESPH